MSIPDEKIQEMASDPEIQGLVKKLFTPGPGVDKVTLTFKVPGQPDLEISSDDLKGKKEKA